MISEAQFNKAVEKEEEVLKWRNLKKAIYQIIDYTAFDGKYGRSMVLNLKTPKGETIKVWSPKRLTEALESEGDYNYVRNNGLKASKSGNHYWSFDLAFVEESDVSELSSEDEEQ